jgi:hypothetical protein
MPSDRVPGTPRVLDKLYARATAPEREQRYESAEAFRDDVTAALHKINPRATREHLAQFLNHLFLGGQAPPSVDTDALNKSVAMHVQELYASTDAFNRPKTEDVRDRALAEFSDDAPQTGAHEVMRAARVGDVLTHEQLTGEALAQPINVVDEEPEVIPDGTDFITPLPSSLDQPPVAPEGLAVWDEGTALTNPTSVYEGPAWGSGASGSQDGKTASYVALAHSMATVVGGAAGSSEDIIVEPEPTEIRGVSLPPLRAPGPPPVDLPERRLHARMPQEPLGLHDLDTARVKPVPPLEETSQEVFANAGDSMIIEFEHGEPTAQAELQDPSPEKRRRPTPPPMPGDTSAIRPAAQPLGKRVVPAVATARPRPREETSSTTTNTAGGLPVPPVTPRRR